MFLALLISLPTGNATLRMRVWRALKETGCGVLRDGVYLLPAEAPGAASLVDAEAEIKAAGGFAMTVELKVNVSSQLDYVRKLFDRTKEYAALVASIGSARTALARLGKRKAETLVQRLRRSFDELTAIDFYPGQAQLQANDAISALERDAQTLFSGGEPRSSRKKVRQLDPAKYRNRTWATRKDLWIDRLASVWLIKRFIDKNAKFKWIDGPRDRPKGAIGFDFDDAQFTHSGNRVTVEVLIESFGLDADPGLKRLAAAVHFLDVGGIPVADAKGIESVLAGIRGKTRSDNARVLEAMRIFDFLYAAYNAEEKQA